MPQKSINRWIMPTIGFVLICTIVWLHITLKKTVLGDFLFSSQENLPGQSTYKKIKWILYTKDSAFIVGTLAHLTYDDQLGCLRSYIADTHATDNAFKIAILFKVVLSSETMSKRIETLNLLAHEEVLMQQPLFFIAAQHCPLIIPLIYEWLKIGPEKRITDQVKKSYECALAANDPTLFSTLMEYDIPLVQEVASSLLNTVLIQHKHQAFVTLLVKAGAHVGIELAALLNPTSPASLSVLYEERPAAFAFLSKTTFFPLSSALIKRYDTTV